MARAARRGGLAVEPDQLDCDPYQTTTRGASLPREAAVATTLFHQGGDFVGIQSLVEDFAQVEEPLRI